MERIWLKHYPAGVPADIDVTQYSSLVALLEEIRPRDELEALSAAEGMSFDAADNLASMK